MAGAPMHFHDAAFNLAIVGSRRWLLLPQRDGLWSNEPILQWLKVPALMTHVT